MSGYLDIYRGAAQTWECDQMGHLNVQFYTGKATEGMGHLRAAFGMTPAYIRETGRTFVAVRSLTRYLRELRAGDILSISAAVRAVGDKTVEIVAEVTNDGTGETSATMEITSVHFDLDARRAVAWPDDLRARIEGMITPRRDTPRPQSTGRPSVPPPGAAYATPFQTYLGTVMPWQCDEFGHMSARFHIDAVTNAIGHLKNRIGLIGETARRNHWGTAGLEYDTHFLAELTEGELVRVTSGMVEVGTKTMRFAHLIENAETGRLAARVEIVSCMLDLEKRKSFPIPEIAREKAQRLIIPWPPADARKAAAD